MEQNDLYEAIFKRKSIRKYNPDPLDEATIDRIGSFVAHLERMYPEIRTETKIMAGEAFRGFYKVQAPYFLSFSSESENGYLANSGFMLQQLDLFLSKENIGCCWQGGIRSVGKARQTSELEFVISLAFGRPAEDPHRKDLSEFKRKPLSEITDIEGLNNLMQPARLAPSAANNQSWYFTGNDHQINAYSAKSAIFGRMNQINVGIALCHIWLAAAHFGKRAELISDDSALANPPKGYSYVASMTI